MPIVNFVDEYRQIMRYSRDNCLSLRERIFWIALFYIANDRATYNAQTGSYNWPDGFISVSNAELNLYSTLDKRGIDEARNALKQRGVIDFNKGNRNKSNPEYKMNYLSIDVGYKIVPNDVPNYVPNHVPKDVPNYVPNHVPKDAPYIIDIDKDTWDHMDTEEDDDTDTREESAGASPAVRIRKWWRSGFGKEPTPAMILELTECGKAYGYGKLEDMIHKAALRGCEDPISYIEEALDRNQQRIAAIQTKQEAKV